MSKSPEQIFQEVRRNHLKLEQCEGHNFSIDMTPDRPMGKKWQCTKCAGYVDGINKKWYEEGILYGRKLI